MQLGKYVMGALLVLGLGACGGGGGGSDGPCLAAGGCGGTTTNPATPEYSLALTPTTTTLKYPGVANVTVSLTDKAGAVVPNAKVAFAVDDTTKATVGSGGSLLTDGNGKGAFTLSPVSESAQGVVTLTATATIGTASATASLALSLNQGVTASSGGAPAVAAKLKFDSTTVKRMFVRGASAGNTNAVEVTQVIFKVRDINDNTVTTPTTVYFDVTRRNVNSGGASNGVLTCVPDVTGRCLNVGGSTGQYAVTSDTVGNATITIQSGSEPLTFSVLAGLSPFVPSAYDSSTGLAGVVPVWTSEQLSVSSNKPDQSQFFLLWEAGATCGKTGAKTFPCGFVINVFDRLGQPVANGTLVNVVSASGGVLMDSLSGNPSGTCLTVDSQCLGKYTGNGTYVGTHRVVAYAQGENATPQDLPIRKDGVFGTAEIVVNCLSAGVGCEANSYIRNQLDMVP